MKEEFMKEELKKELELRGTAEVSNGVVNQVTQAINETDNEVTHLIFGKKTKQSVIPIDQACAKCDFWMGKFATVIKCQESQKKDAEARGFNKLICPHQFVD